MAIPTTKAELLDQMGKTYEKLDAELDQLDETTAAKICVDDWTVSDLITVRTRWAHMVREWIEAGLRGEVPEIPAPGYKWNETPRLNTDIIKKLGGKPWSETLALFRESYQALRSLIESLPAKQVEEVGTITWAGKWSVIRWANNATSTGYTSARKFVRKLTKE